MRKPNPPITIGEVCPFMVADFPRKGKEKMKTPTAKRLPSGAWFCRVRVDGQDIGITRPTEKEAVAEAMAIKAGIKQASKDRGKTVTKAIDDYIALRQNILSPATIRGYRIIQKHHFQSVMHSKIGSVTDAKWKALINMEARDYSAKTLKNAWGFMSSVIRENTGREVEVSLPQLIPNERPFLDAEEIQVFLAAIKGKPIEIPAMLALSSLRRSEIIALDWKHVDLEKGKLYVEAATVQDEHNKMVQKKETKNCTSRRPVPIIKPLRDALEAVENKEGLVYKGSISRLYANINKICAQSGLPEVGIHGLRHSFASLSHHLKVPEAEAMEIGGWKDPETMRRIYTHTYKKTRQEYGTAFTNFFADQNPETKNGNEIANAESNML